MVCASCKITQKEITKHVTVTVIDKRTNKPIDDARVTLTMLNNVEGKDIGLNSQTGNTDSTGKRNFSYDFNEGDLWEVSTRKAKHYTFHDLDNSLSESQKRITPTVNEIILYLTSDSLHLISFYEKITPHYQIDTLIQLLASNHYQPENGLIIPTLHWVDIPRLLEIGNDSTIITKFPRNAFSSRHLTSCYLGMVSLWLIESIRITEQKSTNKPSEKFPSQVSYLMEKGNEKFERSPNNVAAMEVAYQAYQKWWRTTRRMNIKDACKINPLEKTNLYWN